MNTANPAFDYGAATQNAKTAYEGTFGTPATQAQPLTDAQTKLYEDAKAKALEDTKGDFANRGLFFSGDLDKSLIGTGLNFANQESATLASTLAPYTQNEQNSVMGLVGAAASAHEAERNRALSVLPSILMTMSPKSQVFGSPQTGYYTFDQSGNTVQLTNAGGQLTPAGLQLAATEYLRTGQMPALGMGSMMARSQILETAAQIAQGQGLDPNSVVGGWASYSADKTSLANLQKMSDTVNSFESTAKANLQQFATAAKNMIDTGSPLVNKYFRGAEREITGNSDQAKADAARVVAFTEVAKVLSNPTASGVLSDTARGEASSILSGNYTIPQLKAVAEILIQDMDNRKAALAQQVQDIQGRLGGTGTSTASPGSTTPPPTSSGGSQWSW